MNYLICLLLFSKEKEVKVNSKETAYREGEKIQRIGIDARLFNVPYHILMELYRYFIYLNILHKKKNTSLHLYWFCLAIFFTSTKLEFNK